VLETGKTLARGARGDLGGQGTRPPLGRVIRQLAGESGKQRRDL
jgi:hypothetical protein